MALRLVGKKVGMTRIVSENGVAAPATVIQILPNSITQVKSMAVDGYDAIQVTTGSVKANRINKAQKGLFSKAKVDAGRGLWEFRCTDASETDYKVGDLMKVDLFSEIKKVDVSAVSKGKGFAGGVKRWNFGMQDATHGNSISHRAIGSTGQCQTPGRVLKGKKMAGQMGNKTVTTQSLKVLRCDVDNALLIVKGAVPGKSGANVVITPAIKG